MGRTENVELTVLCLIEYGNTIPLQNRLKKDWQEYALPGGVQTASGFDFLLSSKKALTFFTIWNPPILQTLAVFIYACRT